LTWLYLPFIFLLLYHVYDPSAASRDFQQNSEMKVLEWCYEQDGKKLFLPSEGDTQNLPIDIFTH